MILVILVQSMSNLATLSEEEMLPCYLAYCPCLPTQDVANRKLDGIKGEVENKTVKPNDSRPSPSNTLDLGKSPICIHSKECCYLQFYSSWHSSDIITVSAEGGEHVQSTWKRTAISSDL